MRPLKTPAEASEMQVVRTDARTVLPQNSSPPIRASKTFRSTLVARWITFDSLSAEQLMEYQPQETVTVLAGSALQMAMDDPSDSVVVMPGLHAGTALVV